MRTIIIDEENFDEIKFKAILRRLYSDKPYAIVNHYFLEVGTYPNGRGIITFWDLAYVPEDLMKYVTAPPQKSDGGIKWYTMGVKNP